jgi:hypothetical protein
MSIKSEIKKEGIEIITPLDSLTINSISTSIAKLLRSAFPEKDLDERDLFSRISNLRMYIAKLPAGCSAKYYYKNKSIYFCEGTSFLEISDLIVHECIHYLQEKYNKNNKLIQLGLCDYTKPHLPGTGLNEAGVQLLASKCTNRKSETVTYYGITFNTISPNYYPLECCLINQLNELVGNNVLFDSVFNSNNNFKTQLISLTSQETFNSIERNFDLLLEKEETISNLIEYNTVNYSNTNIVKNNCEKINNLKFEIKTLFLSTQNLIIESYFDNAINLVYTKFTFDKYRNKLFNFRNFVATSEGYTFFNKYYINKMSELETLSENNFNFSNSSNKLCEYKHDLISIIFRKIKSILGINWRRNVERNSEN